MIPQSETESQKGHYVAAGDWNCWADSARETAPTFGALRGKDLNLRPLGYEPNELPDCSTPHRYGSAGGSTRQTSCPRRCCHLRNFARVKPPDRSRLDSKPR